MSPHCHRAGASPSSAPTAGVDAGDDVTRARGERTHADREELGGESTNGAPRSPPGHARGSEQEQEQQQQQELWLVFHDEGVSLSSLIFSTAPARQAAAGARPHGLAGDSADTGVPLLHPSPLWVRLRTAPAGRELLRSLVRQLVRAVATCHAAGIAHRDIKSANVLVGTAHGRFDVRLADFGSATDDHASVHLYGAEGPTYDEVTMAYAPPEALVGGGGAPPPVHVAPASAATPVQSELGGEGGGGVGRGMTPPFEELQGEEGVEGGGGSGSSRNGEGDPPESAPFAPPPPRGTVGDIPWGAYDSFSLGVTLLEVLWATPASQVRGDARATRLRQSERA